MITLAEKYNASTMLDTKLAAGLAAKTAIICGDERISYGELFGRVCRIGSGLRRLGIRPGERVILVLRDTPLLPAAFLGTLRIGAVPCLLNPLFNSADYLHFVRDSDAAVAIIDSTHLEEISQSLAGTTILAPTATQGHVISIEEFMSAEDDTLTPADTHRDDMAFWLYSGGSTGRPKAVIHAHQDIPSTYETYARNILKITEDDVSFARAIFHAYGLGGGVTFPLSAGATSVLCPDRPTPAELLRIIDRHRPSLLFLIPTLYKAILDDRVSASASVSSLRLCISAAESSAPEIWHRWRKTFGLEIIDGVGSTEMLHIYCSNAPGAVRPGSSGKAVPGYKLRLVDEIGLPITEGNAGILQVSGQSSSLGYWRQRVKTQQVMLGEWISTGDRYHLDEDGFYWYKGRADDMVKIGGEWVSPIEIENVLLEHPAVLEVAITGCRVDDLTRIRALIVPVPDHDNAAGLAAELQEWCKSRLQRYQYPHHIEFVDPLPRTAIGKIERFRLREQPRQS